MVAKGGRGRHRPRQAGHFPHPRGAAALQSLRRPAEARKEVEIALQLNPKFNIRLYRSGAQSDNPIFLQQRERTIEALRAAGIREG
jgi:hypothetical protein